MAETTPIEVDVLTVKSMMTEAPEEFVLLDCRTPEERTVAHLEPSEFIQMTEIENRIGELGEDRQKRIVVYCHMGGRSLMVAEWLRKQGFINAQSMAGGIDAWAVQVDPSCRRY